MIRYDRSRFKAALSTQLTRNFRDFKRLQAIRTDQEKTVKKEKCEKNRGADAPELKAEKR